MKHALLTATALLLAAHAQAGTRSDAALARTCNHETIFACDSEVNTPPPPGSLEGVEPIRRAIVSTAASQIGVVSNLRSRDCNKRGWNALIDFHERAYGRELNAHERRILKRPYLARGDEVKLGEWCGIFALWAVKTAASGGASGPESAACGSPPLAQQPAKASDYRHGYLAFVRWVQKRENGQGAGIEGLPYVAGTSGMQPGDIAVFEGTENHHAIVERVVGNRVHTIDGNTDCGMVLRKIRPLTAVAGHYSTN